MLQTNLFWVLVLSEAMSCGENPTLTDDCSATKVSTSLDADLKEVLKHIYSTWMHSHLWMYTDSIAVLHAC